MGRLTRLRVPGPASRWAELGFVLVGDRIRVGEVLLETGAAELVWGFDGLEGDPARLGVPTESAPAELDAPGGHPNRVDRVDHVVYAVPDLDAGVEAVEEVLGLDLRRRARPRGPDGPEMAFFRAGEAILEVVSGGGPALWGLALRSPDLDATVGAVRGAGGPIGDPKPAVQGGRIATVPTDHLGVPLAVMEPARRGPDGRPHPTAR